MSLRSLIPFSAATTALLILGTSMQDCSLRAAFVEVGTQTQLPLESVALGNDDQSELRPNRTAIPAAAAPSGLTRVQRARFMHLQQKPAIRRVRGDYKYWT